MGAGDGFSLRETASLVLAHVVLVLHGYLAFPLPVFYTAPSQSVHVCVRLCASQGRDLGLWSHISKLAAS